MRLDMWACSSSCANLRKLVFTKRLRHLLQYRMLPTVRPGELRLQYLQ
jgi:hypothetical protein